MPQLTAVDAAFLTTAPYRTTRSVLVPAPPAAVFAAIAEDPAGWGDWFPGFSRTGRYRTPPPPGVGAEREMRLGGAGLVETVIAWEAPTRWAFRVSEARLPGVRAMAEGYVLEPESGGTRVTWTLALETSPGFVAPVMGAASGALVPVALRRLGRRLAGAGG
jgi:carbon monoxide dehydrogenase subunit G